MVGFQALHLKPTKPCTELKKKKEIIVEMLTARKSNEKKGAVEEHNLKVTGKDKDVVHNSSTIGMRKSLVFHVGKLPKGIRTDWMMYEYRLESKELKSGSGPKIGEQYGAPFNEEDYDDDTTTEDSFPLGLESLDCQTTLFNPMTEQAMTSAIIETSSNHDFLEFDGILLDEFLEFLNNSPPRENAHHEIPDSVVPNKTVDETSSNGVVWLVIASGGICSGIGNEFGSNSDSNIGAKKSVFQSNLRNVSRGDICANTKCKLLH
ncbi:NAC domain-containing protein 82-like [Zingiber officinale]|uniref:NAC domain-containing protein 82-like n=1 Tax=Zingiber officinale TaxID=94328 RepID=UPI001C4CBC46|nr:NAC domain-containing protein 82-like [Zingiber officinale]